MKLRRGRGRGRVCVHVGGVCDVKSPPNFLGVLSLDHFGDSSTEHVQEALDVEVVGSLQRTEKPLNFA